MMSSEPAVWWDLLKVFFLLAGMLALARWMPTMMGRFGGSPTCARSRHLRLLESLYLSSDKSVHLVEVDGVRLVLGSTRGGIHLLTQMPPEQGMVPEPVPEENAHRAFTPSMQRECRPVIARAAEPIVVQGLHLLNRVCKSMTALCRAAWRWGTQRIKALLSFVHTHLKRRGWSQKRPGWFSLIVITLIVGLFCIPRVYAQTWPAPRVTLGIDAAEGPQDLALSLQIIILLTILTLAPSILVLLTSFTRTVVVLSFVRNAVGTNQMPPNQVLIGLALFLTIFTMAPTFQSINQNALQPYLSGELDFRSAGIQAQEPLREFMLNHTRHKDLALFMSMSSNSTVEEAGKTPWTILVPAFVISELKSAFQMGFILYIPFLVIDMIVASVLMSLGMMMLPPMMISLPFKILLFVLTDGWYLVVRSILLSYQVGG